jgi:hypothetical protein
MLSLIDKIEKLYQTVNIKRAIIFITNNKPEKINEIYKQLLNNHHIPVIIDDLSIIDYNYRLYIINDIQLLDKFEKDSFNIIIIDG